MIVPDPVASFRYGKKSQTESTEKVRIKVDGGKMPNPNKRWGFENRVQEKSGCSLGSRTRRDRPAWRRMHIEKL